jgi:hypothetical protein
LAGYGFEDEVENDDEDDVGSPPMAHIRDWGIGIPDVQNRMRNPDSVLVLVLLRGLCAERPGETPRRGR